MIKYQEESEKKIKNQEKRINELYDIILNQSKKSVKSESQKDCIPEMNGTIEEEKSNEQVLDQIQMSFSESMDITQS